jgi:hypothetical protein
MTAARHIPSDYPHTDSAIWGVNFTYSGGSTITNSNPSFKGVSAGDTVNFSNDPSSTATIVITFAANPPVVTNPPGAPLFNVSSITLNPGDVSPQTVLSTTTDGSVNYSLSVNGVQVGGPYAIQVGNGPLYVEITNSDSEPDPIMVPYQGTLTMFSNDPTTTYSIHWPTTNPFPGLTEALPGATNNNAYTQVGPKGQSYGYRIGIKFQDGPGGGTIRIGST